MTPVMPMKRLGKWLRREDASSGVSVKQWTWICVSCGTVSVNIWRISSSASLVWMTIFFFKLTAISSCLFRISC